MARFKYDEFGEYMIQELPELRPAYQAELSSWSRDRPGPYVIVDTVLEPAIRHAASDEAAAGLDTLLAFVERMASHDDENIQALVIYSICEALDPSAPETKRIVSRMGPHTLRWWQRVQEGP
jgi:hypothetical protein